VLVKCLKDENPKYLKLHGHEMKISTLLVETRHKLHLQQFTEISARLDLLYPQQIIAFGDMYEPRTPKSEML
jgi:hypothetical protein